MDKRLLVLFFLLVPVLCWTPPGNVDLKNTYNITNAPYIYATMLDGSLGWGNLSSYPVACPSNTYVSQVDDSITCTALSEATGTFKVDDYLEVGEYSSSIVDKSGMAFINSTIWGSGGIGITAKAWIPEYVSWSSNRPNPTRTSLLGDGSYDYSSNYLCDFVNNLFLSSDEVRPRPWVMITNGTYAGAMARITTYVNASCVRLGLNPAWSAATSGFNFIIVQQPDVVFNDYGSYRFEIKDNTESEFFISGPNAVAPYAFEVDTIAGADEHSAVRVKTDANNKEGSRALNVFLTSRNATSSGKKAKVVDIAVDPSLFTSSQISMLNLRVVGMAGSGTEIDAIEVSGDYDHILHVGSSDSIGLAWFQNTTSVYNLTVPAGSSTNNMQIFNTDDSDVYIGADVNFTRVAFALSTTASATITPTYYYCNSVGSWATLTGVADTTNGMQSSGSIAFINPVDRGTCNKTIGGTNFNAATNQTYIAIRRTRNSLTRPPIERTITISGASTVVRLWNDLL